MYVNKDSADHLIKKILDFKIDNRRRDSLIKIKNCLMYKIKYEGFNEGEDSLK